MNLGHIGSGNPGVLSDATTMIRASTVNNAASKTLTTSNTHVERVWLTFQCLFTDSKTPRGFAKLSSCIVSLHTFSINRLPSGV
jgi:hypothetical protein